MRLFRLTLILALAGSAFLLAPYASAQQWDPIRYIDLLEEGDSILEEAQALDRESTEYEERLYEALRLKQEALEMLRRALLADQIPHHLIEDASVDLFNLSENVMYLLMQLDQCAAAELLLDRAATDIEILPEGGAEHLVALRDDLQECQDRIDAEQAAQRGGWNYETYLGHLEQAQAWRQRAYAEQDLSIRKSHLFDSAQYYGQALDMLREALVRGDVRDSDPVTVNDLWNLYDTLITIFLDMEGRDVCPNAERRLDEAIADANVFLGGNPARYEARRAEIELCYERAAGMTAMIPPGFVPREEVPPLPERANVGPTPWVMFGVGGAAAIAAVAVDLATGSDRDELDTIRNDCDTLGTCDYGRAVELSGSINDRKAIIGVLAGVSVVTIVIGGAMLLLNDTEAPPETEPPPDREAQVEPVLGFDQVGVRITF